VVDEIVGASIGLALCPWPSTDEKGRLIFESGATHLIGCDRNELLAFLAQHRLPTELRERPLRIGDVFAVRPVPGILEELSAELEEPRRLEPFLPPERWIAPPVYDITAVARDEAKTAFYAAVTPTLGPQQAAELQELASDGSEQ
jgi:hypothetical protein